VPSSAQEALAELRRRGILVFSATGRPASIFHELPPLQALEFDGGVTLNGQYCYDKSGVIYANPIPPCDIAMLLEHVEKAQLPCAFIEADRIYMNRHDQRVAIVHDSIHSAAPPLGDLRKGLDQDIFQIWLYLNEEELSQLPHLPHTKYTRWHGGGIDLIPADGGKATGIGKVLAHFGIAKEEAIAFGDACNDLDMFRAVGISVAMGNACDAVKAAADYVTTDIDDDGIYHALKHFQLI
jgi:Cof subfamily protein (haloacid dehalogenase superfamily)